MRETTDERTEGENSNPGADVANRYFSVAVTPTDLTSSLLALTATEGASDTNSYNYLRLGAPDNALEGKLPPDPNKPQERGAGGASSWKDGALLYTSGTYRLVAPSEVHATHEDLATVSYGGHLASATYTAGYAASGLKVAYQNMVQITATNGSTINQTLGLQHNFWHGNWVNYGLGIWLNGVVGSQIGLRYGQSIVLESDIVWLEGKFGSLRATKALTDKISGPIVISSDGENEGLREGADRWLKWGKRALALAALLSTAATAGELGTGEAGLYASDDATDELKREMVATTAIAGGLSSLFLVVEAGIVLFAYVIRAKKVPDGLEESDEDDPELRLDGSNPAAGNYLAVGDRTLWFGANGAITIKNGEAGPSITLTKDAIELAVGPTTGMILNNQGIKFFGPGITEQAEGATLRLGEGEAVLAAASVSAQPVDPAVEAQAAAGEADIAAQDAETAAEQAAAPAAQVAQWFENLIA